MKTKAFTLNLFLNNLFLKTLLFCIHDIPNEKHEDYQIPIRFHLVRIGGWIRCSGGFGGTGLGGFFGTEAGG